MQSILTIGILDQGVPTFDKGFEEIIVIYVPLKVGSHLKIRRDKRR